MCLVGSEGVEVEGLTEGVEGVEGVAKEGVEGVVDGAMAESMEEPMLSGSSPKAIKA